MGVNIGDACRLYKKCTVCGELKYMKSFSPTGGRRSGRNKRKSYCRDCRDCKHERTPSLGYVYSFDTSLLERIDKVTIRGRDLRGCKYEGNISYEKAVSFVAEGAAGIFHGTLIHQFYNKKSLRVLVFERDNYLCHYCGRSGDTINHDHNKIPKSKGGLNTPRNCICACENCNRKKADTEYKEYMLVRHNQRY